MITKNSSEISCPTNFSYSCFIKDDKFILSIPISAFKYYYPNIEFELTENLVTTSILPHKMSYKNNDFLNNIIFVSFLFYLIIIFRRTYNLNLNLN